MTRYLVSLMVFVASLGLASSASAVVVPSSTYSVYVEGSASGVPFTGIATFDSVEEQGSRNGLALTVNESETSLGGKNTLISINVSANGDLFPISGETAILAVGSEDPLDFITLVSLFDARVTLRDINGNILFASDNLAFLAANNSPWDGAFPAPSNAFGIDDSGGIGIASITFDFSVTELSAEPGEVPEPGTLLLCSMGLMGIAWRRRHPAKA
jgi:hypothetical protein